MGWTMNGPYIYTDTGQTLTLQGNRIGSTAGVEVVNKLKIGYSKQVLTTASQKFGFQKVVTGTNKFVFTKGV